LPHGWITCLESVIKNGGRNGKRRNTGPNKNVKNSTCSQIRMANGRWMADHPSPTQNIVIEGEPHPSAGKLVHPSGPRDFHKWQNQRRVDGWIFKEM
jgi:hypothetical protein